METYYPTVAIAEVPLDGPSNRAEHDPPVVLVVDDDPAIVATLRAILSNSGYAAITANDRFEALDLASLIPPNVLISGVCMPHMKGLTLAIEIRRAIPDCGIILCAGPCVDFERMEQARQDGYDICMLVKPVEPKELLACISRCLAIRDSLIQVSAKADSAIPPAA